MATTSQRDSLRSWERFLVPLAAVICGAAVMELELLGARVVGPMFGVSLFVWTALITVTLLALATGYFLGGRLADRAASLKLMGTLIGTSGALLLLVPLLRQPVLKYCSGLGVRFGALVAALVLFGPVLTLLGTVTPIAVKIFLRDTSETGRTVGWLSALSTLGSFAGTVGTGFWLIPLFHVNQLAVGTAGILLALAAGLLAGPGRVAAAALVLPALLLMKTPPLASTILPSGTKASLIHREGTFYGQISVVDYTYPPRHIRELLVDGIVQDGVDVTDSRSVHGFAYFQEQAGLVARPGAKTALVIGLGAGIVPTALAGRGLTGTAVEIDPAMARVAERYFGYDPRGPFGLSVEDGRRFLQTDTRRYDLAFLDVFTAENNPAHLLTREAFSLLATHLEEGGALVINFAGFFPSPGADNRALDTLVRTLKAVFPRTHTYFNPKGEAGQLVSFTLVGQKAGAPVASLTSAGFTPVHPMCAQDLEGFLETSYLPATKDGPIYTDDWCPVEADSAASKLLWRQNAMGYTPVELLTN